MSNIEEISEQLSAYLDGELSSEETRRVVDMVAEDPALSDELESMREVRQLLRGLPHEQAPDGLLDTVLAGTQRKRTGWWVGRLARAAVIILAVGVSVTVTSLLNRPAERNGTQTPQRLKTPPLVRGGLVHVGDGVDAVTNVRINTDNLILTQREVEKVFGQNNIEPVVAASEPTRVAKGAYGKHMGRGNYYNQTQVAPNQVRYELAITENQMRQVVSELNEIRARQIVSQCPTRHRDGDNVIALAKEDFDDKSATGAAKAAEYAKIRRRASEKKREKHGKHLADDGKHKVADSKPAYVAKPCPRPMTTMPDTIVMKQQHNIRSQKPLFSQTTTTLATANIRQLVVILNVVAAN